MTAHRHKNAAGLWVTVRDGTHTHPDLAAAIAALDARVAALEQPPPPPEPPPTNGTRVGGVLELLDALDDDGIGEIIVANGTYRVSTAASQKPDSLWIGARFSGRTRPVTVRAETTGGVTFDGGGADYFGGIIFAEGAHDQTWQGFRLANGRPTSTGAIVFGGYQGKAPPHHLTLRDWELDATLRASTAQGDQGVYFSWATSPGPHDILLDGLTVDGSGGLWSGLHFYHSDGANLNASNVTVRRATLRNLTQAVVLWDASIRNVTIADSTISGSREYAVRYESGGTVTLANVTSTGSALGGFYSSLGPTPPGVTFVGCDLR